MAVLRYTLLRVFVLAVVAALLWLVGFRGYLLLLVAFFVSGIISVFVLNRSRDKVSAALDRRLSTIKERRNAEDAWDDARRTERAAQDDGRAATSDADAPRGPQLP